MERILFWVVLCCFTKSIPAEEFVLCPDSASRTIECLGQDEVIDVHRARLVYSKNVPCSDPDIIQKVKSGEALQCEDELPMTQCHGEKSCSVDGTQIGRVISCNYGYNSNLLFVQYSCYKFADDTTIQTFYVGNSVTGQKVDIMSPGFPCPMPQQPDVTGITCTITPHRQNEHDRVKILVEYKLIKFEDQQTDCIDHIYIQRQGFTQVMYGVCNIAGYPTNIRNEKNPIDETGSSYVISSHQAGSMGAKFWIQVAGQYNGAAVDLTVTCSYPYGTPVLAQAPTPAPSSPPDATNSPPADSDPALAAPTTPDTGGNLAQPVTSQEQDKSNDVGIGGVIGGVIGGALVASLIFGLLYFFKIRKNTTTDTKGPALSFSSGASGTADASDPTGYEIPTGSSMGGVDVRINDVAGDEPKYEEIRDVVATVRKESSVGDYENMQTRHGNNNPAYSDVAHRNYEQLNGQNREQNDEKTYTKIDLNIRDSRV